MNTKFQNKLYKKLGYTELLEDKIEGEEIYHNFLSPLFIEIEELKKIYSMEEIKILLSAVYYHHNRKERVYDQKEIIQDLEEQLKDFGEFYGIHLKINNEFPKKYILENDKIKNLRLLESKLYILIKGLLNKIDYIASIDEKAIKAEESVYDEEKMCISDKIEQITQEKYQNHYRPVQKYMMNHKEDNLVVVSPTGSGKTEASLLWIGNKKGFYTLPLKVSINAIYERIHKDIKYKKALLLHSDAYTYYFENTKEEDYLYNYERAKNLAAPLIVTTVDQLFKITFKYIGYEEILATLSYSKIVIDEIQMYSSKILAYILVGLKMITKVGGKFAIVTATFPPVLYELMDYLQIEYKKQTSYFQMHLKNRHKIEVLENCEIDIEEIRKAAKSNKVLVIVNTVRKAQEIYRQLRDEKVFLLHSRYTKRHRQLLEREIIKFGSSDNSENGIWISTQIVEASLDIDFDVLFTEMCSIDSLFQRMGRVYRKREYSKTEANVFIYDSKNGLEGKIPIVDPEIYRFSLKEILKYNHQNLQEEQKQEIISNIFDSKLNPELKDSKYYRDIINTIDLFIDKMPNNTEKNEIIELFRDIQNIALIPDTIYDALCNNDTIEDWKNTLKASTKEEKLRIKDEIRENTVNVTKIYNLEYDKEEMFFPYSNIYRTRYQYDFNEEALKGEGLIIEKLDRQGVFDE